MDGRAEGWFVVMLTDPGRGRFVSPSFLSDLTEEEGWIVVRLRQEDYEGLLSLEEQLEAAHGNMDRYGVALAKIADLPTGEFLVGVRRREGAEYARELAREALNPAKERS